VEIHISLVGRKDLSGEIYCQLQAAIATGKLRAGEALPSTRELASRLSVSRGTVATVSQLVKLSDQLNEALAQFRAINKQANAHVASEVSERPVPAGALR